MPLRSDGRRPDQLRPVQIEPGCLAFPAGSVLLKAGRTHLLCTASVVDGVPEFLKRTGSGWLTADYAMLPASTPTRKPRETPGAPTRSGRAQEIRRLIGRSLRAAVDLKQFGERTIWMDCDVLQADGGTRTLAVTGAWVALALALRRLTAEKVLRSNPLRAQVAAVSVGVVKDRCVLDMAYDEDSAAEVDMNVVLTSGGRFVEIQGTAETKPFEQRQLAKLLALARKGCRQLMRVQRAALRPPAQGGK